MTLTRSKKVVIPLLVLAGALAIYAYLVATRAEATAKPDLERVWSVSALPAHFETIQPDITAFGEVVSGRHTQIKPLVSGQIVEISPNLLNGAVVQQGDLLAVIDPFEYETRMTESQAALREAKSKLVETKSDLKAERQLFAKSEQDLVLRQRDLERTKNLTIRGTASEKARDDAELAVSATEQALTSHRQAVDRLTARLEQQQASISMATAGLNRAERDLQYTRVIAPFAGFIADADAALGKRVRDGDPLARLIDANRLEASFQLNNNDFSRLLADDAPGDAHHNGLIGRPVTVNWRVGARTFSYPARIERVGAEFDAATGGVDVYAVLIDPDVNAPIRPGAFVQIAIPDRRYENVLLLPNNAVDSNGTTYIVNAGRLESATVKVHRHVGDQALVSASFPPGTLVVTSRSPEFGPGAKVIVK